MKTEIIHNETCEKHIDADLKCTCCPTYTIEPIIGKAITEAADGGRAIHEGETDARIDYFTNDGLYVQYNAVEILKLKMNPECSLSAKEYWYLCGIQDAISVLKQF